MKRNIYPRSFFVLLLCLMISFNLSAQCPAGMTRDTLNWDYLDFLPNSGTYISPTAFLTLAQSQNQKFTFGTQQVTVTHNYVSTNIGGDVNTHTAETGSYGKGDDIKFRNNGTITFTFKNAVQNVKFSLYDVDRSQAVNISALNGIIGTNVALSTLTGTILSISNNNTSNAVAVASSAIVGNTDNPPLANGTLNVSITGPVTSFTLAVTGSSSSGTTEDGSFFISDISACSSGTFPIDYYNISKPFAGQPSYFLAVLNNNIYYVNVNNGVARLLFKDPGFTNLNSLAYDPYRHMVYYSYSLTGSPQTDKTIKRYDYDMDTIGIFIPNVNTLGIPTFQSGVESGAAAFYDGAYYIGIEGSDMNGSNSSRESIVWRVNLTPLYAAGTVAQVYALPVDNGEGTALHDWSDIGINDGILYDFDGASGAADFYHKNLLTGSGVNILPSPSSLVPRQVSVDWQGKMYNSGSPSASSSGTVAPYNEDGTINTSQQYTMRYGGVPVSGSWGDAAEAFKPKTDFGDAPASYDPAGSDPGTHERNDSIRLGNSIGIEWNKRTSANASGDGAEEDGLTGLQVITTGVSNFTVAVKVYNRTGRNATLAGWIDSDGDGIYETSEGVSVTVPSNLSIQTVNLLWTGINTTLPAYSTTFMRIRIATADQGMTTAKPTGYFDNGEIEDFMVSVTLLLPDQRISLKAQKLVSNTVNLLWELNDESNNKSYELQGSKDGISWKAMTTIATSGGNIPASYSYPDKNPSMPVSYYRVKIMKNGGRFEYSDVKQVDFKKAVSISIAPNPAKTNTVLTLQSLASGKATLNILDFTGRSVYDQQLLVTAGANEVDLPIVQNLSSGVYKVRVQINDEILVTGLVIRK